MSQPGKLEVSKAGTQMWLVKVPNFVAKQWRAQCEAAKQGQSRTGPELGRVRMTVTGEQQPELSLTLTGQGTEGLPKEYRMRVQTADAAPMYVFAEQQGSTSVDGLVSQKFDLEMSTAAGSETIDPRYSQLSRARHEAASTKTRVMQVIDDPRSIPSRPAPVSVAAANKRKVARGEKPSDNKRVRIERDQLEKLLFSLFERQAHWSFSQLLLQTEQPVPWLKEVLADVAVLNKRGPNQNQYELKKEYKRSRDDDPMDVNGAD